MGHLIPFALRARLSGASTFRLALASFAVFAFTALILLGAVYFFTARLLDAQTAEAIDTEIRALEAEYRRVGTVGLARAIGVRAAAQRSRAGAPGRGGGMLYLLVTPAGDAIAGNLRGWPDVGDGAHEDGRWLRFEILGPPARPGEGPDRRQAQAAAFTLEGGLQLLVGRDLDDQAAFRDLIGAAMLWAALGAIAIAGLGAWAVARHVERRLEGIRAAAQEIVDGDLKRRMPASGADDEFDRLAAMLNRMLDRIDGLMDGFRTIADDVAHDMRGPLSRLRARLELALIEQEDAAGLRAVVEETLAETERLLAIFNAVASIAHLDSGAQTLAAEPLDLAEITRDAADLYGPALEDAGLTLTVDAPGPAPARGDRALIGQALANLLDNAAAHAAPTARRVALTARPGVISVADDGPGVPAEERARVLERRVRLDASRHRPGAGLGLSLAAAVARAHGGALTLEDGLEGRGLTARLTVPESA